MADAESAGDLMAAPDRLRLRTSFGEDAELYDRVRPGYPLTLVADLLDLAGLTAGGRVLEIGCGTGQLTAALAAAGCEVVAVELSASLAAVARRHLAGFEHVRVDVAAFEDWPLQHQPFDAVVAATAFHWIDPAVRVVKAAAALRPRGALATIATHHVAGGTEAFFAEVQACYERWDPSTPLGLSLPPSADIPEDRSELEVSPLFDDIRLRREEVDITYTTERYLEVLSTYSGHRALSDERRQRLLRCIATLIDDHFGGRITKRYLFELRVARRTSDPSIL